MVTPPGESQGTRDSPDMFSQASVPEEPVRPSQSARFTAESIVAGANKSHRELIVIVTKEALIRQQVLLFCAFSQHYFEIF